MAASFGRRIRDARHFSAHKWAEKWLQNFRVSSQPSAQGRGLKPKS